LGEKDRRLADVGAGKKFSGGGDEESAGPCSYRESARDYQKPNGGNTEIRELLGPKIGIKV